MKIKTTIISLFAASSAFLTSCDTSSPLDNLDDIAPALSVPALGDQITFTSEDGVEALGFLPLEGQISTFGDISYLYEVAGENLFNLTVLSFIDESQISNALLLTLGPPAPLNSALRALLQRPEPNFTDEEIAQITGIIAAAGGNVRVSEDDPQQIIFPTSSQYRAVITSTIGDRNLGAIGGTYLLEGPSQNVIFRGPSDEELALFRFLSPEVQIPAVDTSSSNSVEVFERGTFVLELENVLLANPGE